MPLVRSTAATGDSAAVATIDRSRLREDLESGDLDVRRAAVRLASRLGEAELLVARLDDASDAGMREAVLTGLVRIGGVKAARPLIQALRNADASLRNAVIETLQSMGDAVVPEVEALLDEDSADLRIYAVNVLVSLRSPRVPEIALKVLATDPHVNVCAAAVDVLAEVGGPEMVEALRAVSRRFPDQPFLAFAVRAAIKRIG
jgi:HEAT repeat protein